MNLLRTSSMFSVMALVMVFTSFAIAQPKPMVLVEDTEDRWITFADGSRLLHGFEISQLVLESLHRTGKFQLVVPGIDSHNGEMLALSSRPHSIVEELKERLPGMVFTYFNDVKSLPSPKALNNGDVHSLATFENSPLPHVIIRPRVETLLYASGERSNRIVYGFSPDRLNPYNSGRKGDSDNEFTRTEYGKSENGGEVCENVDFFSGQMNPLGFGPGLPNFGANADEGIELFIFGYGFGFKKKTFEVKSEIVFQVELPQLNQIREFRYELKGSGKDISVGVSYQGISVGVEVGRRATLRMALQSILNNIVDHLISDIPPTTWTTEISGTKNGEWFIPAGLSQGVLLGLELASSFGSQYVVTKTFENHSVITPDPQNAFKPFVREVLAILGSQIPTTSALTSAMTSGVDLQTFRASRNISSENHDLGKIDLKEIGQAANLPPPVTGNCLKKNPSGFAKFLMGLSWIYGYIRYKTVFDQAFNEFGVTADSDKIALVASGIDPKDDRLSFSLDNSGFDFISWDTRPSDDLGMGTAAAILLKESLNNSHKLVSLKVLTPFGETHSSAIYQSLVYAAEREDIRTVLIPFKPAKPSQALVDGVKLLIAKGKTVFLPQGITVPGAIESEATQDYQTKGLSGKKLRLSSIGAGVIQKFIQMEKITTKINSKKKSK